MIIDVADLELPSIFERFVGDQSGKRSGDVRFYKEILHAYKQDANVFFGTRYIGGEQFYIGKSQNNDGHVLVIGGAGTGKSSCIVIPTLGTWGGTFFAIDIKGELSKNWTSVKK